MEKGEEILFLDFFFKVSPTDLSSQRLIDLIVTFRNGYEYVEHTGRRERLHNFVCT